MSIRIACAAALAACALGAHAAVFDPALTNDEIKAEKLRIEQQYDQSRQGCKRLDGHARELCREKARGERDVQQAQLEMRVEPTADHDQKVRLAKAGAQFAIEMVKCKDYDGDARAICRQDAKQTYEEAKEDARLQKEVVAQELRSEQEVSERAAAADRILEAQYNAARQGCEKLPAEGRANCLLDVQKRFGR
jgi:hypothetical protein